MQRSLVACLIVVTWVSVSNAGAQLFYDKTVNNAIQTSVERAFRAKLSGATRIDFSSRPAGPVTGNEWSGYGIWFTQPQKGGLELRTGDKQQTPQIGSHALWPMGDKKEAIEITLTVPRKAVGLWIIDSEYYHPADVVYFFDAKNEVIASLAMPYTDVAMGTKDGNFFVGYVSETPIARVLVDEQYGEKKGNEYVGIDGVWLHPIGSLAPDSVKPRMGTSVLLALATDTSASCAGKGYQVASSLGRGPLGIGKRQLDLSIDSLFLLSVSGLLPDVFRDYAGVLDAKGSGVATVAIPAEGALIGLTVRSAFVVLQPTSPDGIRAISSVGSFMIQ